jgi:hypothetical protein
MWLEYKDNYIFEVWIKIFFYFIFVRIYFMCSLQKLTLQKIKSKSLFYF